ncbi:MAG: hypothetical protein ACXACY_15320 [Candidatus Hodarchaeales archaeon]|jgi:hypothetical protein
MSFETNESKLIKNGYIIIKNVFSDQEIEHIRSTCHEYLFSGNGFETDGGLSKPDWVNDNRLKEIKQLIFNKNIEKIIQKDIFREVEFLGHCDVQVNRSVGWHKDRLNNEARKFEKTNPWIKVNDETMMIYKSFIYLQDHEDNDDCLKVILGSHETENLKSGTVKQIRMRKNDLLIVDVRMTHSAQWSGGYNRFLVSLSFGVNNIFSKEYKQGVKFRQDKQNEIINRKKK